MSNARKVFAAAVLAALAWAVAPIAEAQPTIRIGATIAQTGLAAAPGPNQLRGYQLCVKHMNDKGGVLGRKLELDRDGVQVAHKLLLFQWRDGKKVIVWPEELAANQPRFPTPPWSQRP